MEIYREIKRIEHIHTKTLVMFALESVGRSERMTQRIRSVHRFIIPTKRHVCVRNLEICLQSDCVLVCSDITNKRERRLSNKKRSKAANIGMRLQQ